MASPKRINVVVKSDHIEKIASGSPEIAIAEMVWNALDADATRVDVKFHEGPLDIDEITIEDNGTGIPYKEAESLFMALGGSWKASQLKTNKGRFLHGRDGKGRFRTFILGRVVDWLVTYKSNNQVCRYSIQGRSNKMDEFWLTDEEIISEEEDTGVKVRITDLSKKFHILNTDKAIDRLTPLFALYLSNYPEVTLNIDGIKLDPNQVIKDKHIVPLTSIKKDNNTYEIELELIEWSQLKEKELWFCNENGFPLEIYNKQIRGVGEFGFSGYLKSNFFQYLQNENLLSLGELNQDLNKICDHAIKAIKDYFQKRLLEKARDTIEKWKEEEIYPYKNEPQTPIESAERKVFEIIALNINENLPDLEQADKKTRIFQFRMLRQAIEKSPQDLQSIIQEVLQLPPKKQEQLAELLKDHSLSGIISSSKLVSDRLKFIAGLEHLLFDIEAKKHLKERSQLHRILAENTWIFGHSFSLSVDDQSLTEVLKKHSSMLEDDITINEPVKLLDGSRGIVDLMLSRSIPRNRSNELEHLIVELTL